MSGINASGTIFTSYSWMWMWWSELTGWAETGSWQCVCPLLQPFPLCRLPCYVNSSKICSHKRRNPLGYAAGTRNDFIMIFFPPLPCCCGPAEGLCKAVALSCENMTVEWRAGGIWVRKVWVVGGWGCTGFIWGKERNYRGLGARGWMKSMLHFWISKRIKMLLQCMKAQLLVVVSTQKLEVTSLTTQQSALLNTLNNCN